MTAGGARAEVPTVILVDKKNNELKVAQYLEHQYKTVNSYRTTIGLVKGDKEEEGDLKTPEGIYFFNARLVPPAIKPKFGVMAFYMNYPNEFDRLAGRTGYDIMLHATNEPERLKKDYDSEGCIVVKNEELMEIEDHIRLGLTPILVFSELTSDYLNPKGDSKLVAFFNDWLAAWTTKKIEPYIKAYHSHFKAKGMNRDQWQKYKNGLNQKYATIDVKADGIEYLRHPKYSVILFAQDYSSTFPNGKTAFRSQGTKKLVIAEENGQLKIISETFTPRTWN